MPKSVRVAASAFLLHALLLLVDLSFFAGAYSGRENDRFWPALRIVAFCLFAWTLLQRQSRPWLIGALAFAAFLVGDLVRLGEVFAGPALGRGQRMLTSGLLLSLLMGIGASWWPSASALFRKPAA